MFPNQMCLVVADAFHDDIVAYLHGIKICTSARPQLERWLESSTENGQVQKSRCQALHSRHDMCESRGAFPVGLHKLAELMAHGKMI